ncbi:hypothetical protein [Chloroflexus aggregans]|uniref:CRISPR-associated protein n=1 Tax=Chloroflexus aggregans (strain MD-66 / DSM 9485) TaxID=326427 RepID=B8GB59_CHLAD|nr:hypothetical protein [Chloroflexus aggregans]ACL26659.1 conserved hypothetical protein [Chloroflexus aggregans DSM 9485]
MTWQVYHVILRLRSPLHIGYRKVGNVQRTRPYVTGRALWGALTMRLTRDAIPQDAPATNSHAYQQTGDQVHQQLAFTYFYPALKSGNDYQVVWPWENETLFRRRFLSSYQSTALAYPQHAAAEGMLHEVEYISPHTLDTGQPVYLQGYIFAKTDCTLAWQSALKRLHIGGERGYGWGSMASKVWPINDKYLFDNSITYDVNGDRPKIRVPAGGRLLAHTRAANLSLNGNLEPLVGREWGSNGGAGQHIAFTGVCFSPGSVVAEERCFTVKEFGVWEA